MAPYVRKNCMILRTIKIKGLCIKSHLFPNRDLAEKLLLKSFGQPHRISKDNLTWDWKNYRTECTVTFADFKPPNKGIEIVI